MTTVHEVVGQELTRGGVDTLFGVLGDANLLYVGDFIRSGGRYVGAVDERGAVLMAIGRARTRATVGAVTVTHGPGLTNAITSIVEAVRSRTPLVLLTGDTPPERDYLQSIDIAGVVAPLGALYRRVLDAAHAGADIQSALQLATSARRPVVLDIAYRLLQEEIPEGLARVPSSLRQAPSPDPEALDTALGIVASAARPVVVAGRGAALSGARGALVDLAETLGAPVATSLLGRDLFRGDPFDLGVVGTVGHEIALDTVAAADCVLAFGAGLNHYTTAHGWLAEGRSIVHVDTDVEAIGRYSAFTAGVLGDARAVADSMVRQLRAIDHRPSGFRSEALRERLARRDPRTDFRDMSGNRTVDVRAAMIHLEEILTADRILVTDVGRYVLAPWRYMHVRNPLDFTHTAAFGSIGLGLATAVGAAAADRSRLTVAIVGDGGAMMSLLEFSTAVRHGLPLLVVVVNDRCYGAEWSQLEKFGADPKLSLIDWPSFAEMAQALGGTGLLVDSLDALDAVPDLVAQGQLPLLVDLRIDPAVPIGDIR